MSDSENSASDHEIQTETTKKPAPVKALAALAKARQARKEKAEAVKKEKEDMKKKKEEAVKIVSSLRKPKEPMPTITEPAPAVVQPSASDMMAMIAKLNEKLEKKTKKKVIIQSDSSSEEEVVIRKPNRKPIVPAVDPEFEQWKMDKEKRQIEEANKQKEAQMKMDLKKLFSRY